MSGRKRRPAPGHLATCGRGTSGCRCEEAAYHEAGHAIVGTAIGLRVKHVDLRCDHRLDALGQVQAKKKRAVKVVCKIVYKRGTAAAMAFFAQYTIAGDVAETIRTSELRLRVLALSDRQSLQLSTWRDGVSGNESRAALENLGPEAFGECVSLCERLLFAHWPAVEALVRLILLDGERVGGRMVRRVFRAHPIESYHGSAERDYRAERKAAKRSVGLRFVGLA